MADRLTNEQHQELTKILRSYYGEGRIFFAVGMPTFKDGEIDHGLEVSGHFHNREDMLRTVKYAYEMLSKTEPTEEIQLDYVKSH